MELLVCFLICAGLFVVFPKGFKYMVGTGMGVAATMTLWGVIALVAWFKGVDLITLRAVCTFLFLGIVGGCYVAAKG